MTEGVARNIRFDLSNAPKNWHGAGQGASAFFDALSIMLPQAERYMIKHTLKLRKKIDDPALLEDIKFFKAQEATHTREHENYNKRLRKLGYDVDGLEKKQAKTLRWMEDNFSEEANVAFVVCFEHVTSVMSGRVLNDPRFLDLAEPAFRDIWEWHALEEFEHQSVAFDLLQEIRPGYFFRCWVMLIATYEFIKLGIRNMHSVYRTDKSRLSWSALSSAAGYLFFKPGLLRKMVLPYLDFFRPGFHPSQSRKSVDFERSRSRFDDLASLFIENSAI